MHSIASLASVSILALTLAACGSPAPETDAPVAANNVAASQAATPLAEATEAAAPAGSETSAPLASGSAGPAPTPTADASRTAAPAAAASASATTISAAAPRPPIFAVCGACHAVAPGKDGIGPSLAGVFNAKAGHTSNHAYSDAMKNSGLTWNEATLDRYLNDPRGVVPGTTMSFGGLKNATQRKAVIDYLKTL